MSTLIISIVLLALFYEMVSYYHKKAVEESAKEMRKKVENGTISLEAAKLLRESGYKI